MLTEIPVKDWENCEAVPSTLSALIGVVVPGKPRRVQTVFVVRHLQCLGSSSVKSEADDWIIISCKKCKRASPCSQHPGEKTEERLAVRLTLADGNSQCSVMLYHDLLFKVAATMDVSLQEPLKDTKELCVKASLTCFAMLSGPVASLSRKMAFRIGMSPHPALLATLAYRCLGRTCGRRTGSSELSPAQRLSSGSSLPKTQVDLHLCLVSVGCMDAPFLRGLVRFNQVNSCQMRRLCNKTTRLHRPCE